MLIATVLTALVVGGVVGAFVAPQPAPSADSVSPPSDGLVVSSTGQYCLGNTSEYDGWLYTTADERGYDVSFNVTVVHGTETSLNWSVDSMPNDEYVINLRTQSASPETSGSAEPDCTVGTTVVGTTKIPANYTTVRVAVDGRTIATVDRDGTLPELQEIETAVSTASETNTSSTYKPP
ncbi:hypothetical protein GCM10009019_03190 [Salarchaeum japonicum]|uniref:DUF1102 domain-containing protein n=2 Tax=Salarchaeum japonicum TaxID=555573 RepID=A0AAV3SYH2_9EURY